MDGHGSGVKLGQSVQTQDGRQGIVRYIGTLHIATGDWVGLELPNASGKNDGSVKGHRYFDCAPGHGIFVRKESVARILARNGGSSIASSNGVNGAGKRQSLMSPSPASTPRTGTPASVSGTGTGTATARTSDSSSKSRLSTAPAAPAAPRTSMAPPPARPSIAKSSQPRPSSISSRQSLAGKPLKPAASASATAARPGVSKPLSRPSSRPSFAAAMAKPAPVRTPAPAPAPAPVPVPVPAAVAEPVPVDEGDIPSEQPENEEPEPEQQQQQQVQPAKQEKDQNPLQSVESRHADRREVETLKAKIRTLEKKALESRDRLKAVDTLQSEKDRFAAIIQTLQKKLKANSDEMAGLRAKYEEAERKASQAPATDPSAEWESQLELANIDREMAEEKAAMHEAELEALRARHDELELEVEILREENKELSGSMSAEERSSAGWLQLEKETERLRQALLLLRDHSHELEADLRDQIKELQQNLDETDKVASKYNETAEKLARMEEANRHLIEQLDAAETSDDIVVALQAERDQRDGVIEQLQSQIQQYEEHIQVADELELFHVEEEKKLHQALDESEAVINDQDRRAREQDKAIEDLEYTLTKFRDVVHGLQADIDSMRRDRDISELQAHEMSSKSKAMMDLNLRLQTSATKTQVKTIDYEIGRMEADQAVTQLQIVERFAHDGDGYDRMPVLALLCFKRIKSKAVLTKSLLAERMRERPHLAQDDPFVVFEAMEKMTAIALSCDRFLAFLETCSPDQFVRYTGATVELEPVERAVSAWIEALKRDELGPHPPDYLQRMVGILQDLADKLIDESMEAKAVELIGWTGWLESGMDSSASQFGSILAAVQARLGPPTEENEDSVEFDKQIASFTTKARTVKYLAGKVGQQLTGLRASSMCVGEASWAAFEDASKSADQLASFVRSVGRAVLSHLSPTPDDPAPPTYSSISSLMTGVEADLLKPADKTDRIDRIDLLSHLKSLQEKVEDLQLKASDINSCTEFEPKPAPWVTRAKEVKAKKAQDQDLGQEVARLKGQAQEQVLAMVEKDRVIEEQEIKIEVLESRQRDSKETEAETKMLRDQLRHLQSERDELETQLRETESRYELVYQQQESDKAELERMRASTNSTTQAQSQTSAQGQNQTSSQAQNQGDSSTRSAADHNEKAAELKVQVDMLNSEIVSLQSAVRHLKDENYALRVPVGEAALREERNAWLDPASLGYSSYSSAYAHRQNKAKTKTKSSMSTSTSIRRETSDLLDGLIDLATSTSVNLALSLNRVASTTTATTTAASKNRANRLKAMRQREDVERWFMWKDDVIKRGKLLGPLAPRAPLPVTVTAGAGAGAGTAMSIPLKKDLQLQEGYGGQGHGQIEIVPLSP